MMFHDIALFILFFPYDFVIFLFSFRCNIFRQLSDLKYKNKKKYILTLLVYNMMVKANKGHDDFPRK